MILKVVLAGSLALAEYMAHHKHSVRMKQVGTGIEERCFAEISLKRMNEKVAEGQWWFIFRPQLKRCKLKEGGTNRRPPKQAKHLLEVFKTCLQPLRI